ncbi:MAG: hypothetical protein SW019_05150 [Actinomycetota bacterium]|nr:hypothetical protein [Actinomycetota bacterium]
MKKFIATAVLPAGALLALAAPATAQPGSAATTIASLEAQGFDVRTTRIGSAPLEECSVTNVRNQGRSAQLIPFDDDDINVFTVIPKPKVTVSLNCQG